MLLNISADTQYKGEVQDLEKAKHYIDMIIERDYSIMCTKPELYERLDLVKSVEVETFKKSRLE